MARNSLMPQMQLYDAPQGPNVGNLINPLMAGFQRGDKLRQEGFQNERALVAEGRQGEQLQLAKNQDARAGEAQRMARERAEVERLGKLAQVIHDDPNDATASQRWQSVLQGNPQMGELMQKYGVDPRDHRTGAKFLMAEVGSYMTPAQKEMEAAKLAQLKAQTANIGADSYTAGDGFVLNKRTGQVQPMPEGVIKPSKPPPGYRGTADGNMEAIPGGPADIKQNEKRQSDFASLQYLEQKLDDLSTQANILKNHPGLPGITGVRGMIPNVPGTKAADAEAERTTLLAKTAFATLQDMRNASKTGGALGAIAVQELVMLQNAVVALERSQGTDQFKTNLGRLQAQTEKTRTRIREAYNDHWNRSGEAARQGAGQGPARVRDDSDYARLPSGAQYVDPEGNVRTKR